MSRNDLRVESKVDVFGLLRVLVEHGVDFVVIGGVAVARHGFVRATKGLDIVADPGRDNLEKLIRALQALDAIPLESGDFRPEELPLDLTVESMSSGGNWALRTKHGRLDVMQYIEGALETAEDYSRLQAEAVESRFDFGTVCFAGYEALLDLKTLAGRDADLIDVRALREARRDTAR